MTAEWKPEDCERCVLKSSIRRDDGQEVCILTGSFIQETTCLQKGPLIRAPRTPAELRMFVETTQRPWRREEDLTNIIKTL